MLPYALVLTRTTACVFDMYWSHRPVGELPKWSVFRPLHSRDVEWRSRSTRDTVIIEVMARKGKKGVSNPFLFPFLRPIFSACSTAWQVADAGCVPPVASHRLSASVAPEVCCPGVSSSPESFPTTPENIAHRVVSAPVQGKSISLSLQV